MLSVIAGATDIIGVLGLHGLFTAHITGNLVLWRRASSLTAPQRFRISCRFLSLCWCCWRRALIARAIERAGTSSLQPLLLLQLLALMAFLLLSVTVGPWQDPDAVLAIIAGMCGVAAMAVQNALAQIALKNTPSTAVMTTNVTRLMLDVGTVLVGGEAADIANAKEPRVEHLAGGHRFCHWLRAWRGG